MQINRYVNGEKTEGLLPVTLTNKAIRDVIKEAERRIRLAEEKA